VRNVGGCHLPGLRWSCHPPGLPLCGLQPARTHPRGIRGVAEGPGCDQCLVSTGVNWCPARMIEPIHAYAPAKPLEPLRAYAPAEPLEPAPRVCSGRAEQLRAYARAEPSRSARMLRAYARAE
jgi:hypothetical protein